MAVSAPSGPEWQRLLRHLDLAEGFSLYFVICPSAAHVEAARLACVQHLAGDHLALETLTFDSPGDLRDLANRLLALPPADSNSPRLWISLAHAIPTDQPVDALAEIARWRQALSAGLAGLNQARNLFARRQHRPVLLVGTGDLLRTCAEVAPDLWSIRRSFANLAKDPFGSTPETTLEVRDTLFSQASDDFPSPPPASLADADRALAAAAQVRHRPGAELDLLRYLIRAAKALQGRGHLDKLHPIFDEALSVANQLDLEADTAEAATLLNNLAILLKAANRLTDAEPLFCRALAIDEKTLGPDHPIVAIRLNNLAGLLKATNRLAEAEHLIRRALAIDENALGPDDSKVAIRLSNLAEILRETNRVDEVEPLIRRALAIDENALGPQHPKVAIRLNNLARLLQDTNRLTEAEPLFRRGLAIDENALGPHHPKVAIRLSDLAVLLLDTNRLAEAEPLLRRALAIDENALGPHHPAVATDLNNLANLLHTTNRVAEAEPLIRRALEILAHSAHRNGHEHPSMPLVKANFSATLKDLGWTPEAIDAELARLTAPPGDAPAA